LVILIVTDVVTSDESLSVYTPVDVERMKSTLKENIPLVHVRQYQYR